MERADRRGAGEPELGLQKQVEQISARVSVLETDLELWVGISAVLGLVSGLAIRVIGVSVYGTSPKVTVIFRRS